MFIIKLTENIGRYMTPFRCGKYGTEFAVWPNEMDGTLLDPTARCPVCGRYVKCGDLHTPL